MTTPTSITDGIQVHSTTTGDQLSSSVAALDGGRFIVGNRRREG